MLLRGDYAELVYQRPTGHSKICPGGAALGMLFGCCLTATINWHFHGNEPAPGRGTKPSSRRDSGHSESTAFVKLGEQTADATRRSVITRYNRSRKEFSSKLPDKNPVLLSRPWSRFINAARTGFNPVPSMRLDRKRFESSMIERDASSRAASRRGEHLDR
ncbi:uncharacterized protein LOC143219179 [Lasioglossum baleicum]|uniref:uncharacterized protein LOC143219179 n=1 Tax=Lasioglossum baleicum TaxID=434251 RepID=UPI003FCE990A